MTSIVPDGTDMQDDDAKTIAALVRALETAHLRRKDKALRPLPTIPIGTRVHVRKMGVGTIVGRDGYGMDAVAVIFDEPAPRGYEDGCCADIESCEVLRPGCDS